MITRSAATSCDLLVRLAGTIEGVYGARMTGGGFGGCTVNWCAVRAWSASARSCAREYARATGHRAEIYVCEAAEGAAAVALD